MKIGDTVKYIDDWKKDRDWYLYDIYSEGLCTIVVIRDGKISENRNGEIMLHANIRNLSMDKIRKIII
jgi:hypothetical protein